MAERDLREQRLLLLKTKIKLLESLATAAAGTAGRPTTLWQLAHSRLRLHNYRDFESQH